MFYLNPRLHKPLIALGGALVGTAAGWTGSYFRTRKMTSLLQEHIDVLAEENRLLKEEVHPKIVELMDELRKRTEKMDEVTDLINAAAEEVEKDPTSFDDATDDVYEELEKPPLGVGGPVMTAKQYQKLEELPAVPPLELIKSVFPDEQDRPEWDQEAEDAARQSFPGRPYIISYAEFAENNFGFNQAVVTFYEGDEVAVDANDVPYYNVGDILGPLVFGKGSGDPNICYIRNKKLKTEYEVIRDPGHFAIERQGLDIEEKYEDGDIKHSAILRMRRED